MNREIPGFYYDPEKKKYFKIQASHKAAPGAQYSKDAVKRKRVEHERRQRKVRLTQKLAKEKIRRAPLLRHPLLGTEREVGAQIWSRPFRQEQHGLTYASQVTRKQIHRFEPWPNDYSIKHVIRNNRSGILIASGYRGGESSVSLSLGCVSRTLSRRRGHTIGPWNECCSENHIEYLSSISLSHTGYLLATMDSGPNGDSFLAPRMLPDLGEGGDYRWPAFFAHPIRIRTESSLWCSSPCPEGSKALFAIGTSEGLQTLEGLGSYWALLKKPFANDVITGKPTSHRRTDSSHALVASVEWLSAHVIAAGLKDSAVFLHDLRSGGTATRLQHPHAVTKIRRVDPYRMVVAGLNSLQMYDIRYPANGLQRNPNPNRPSHTSTRPYLSFSDYYPEVIPDFDLSPELGLLASGHQASDDCKVQLFSLRTGDQVSSPLSKYQYSHSISSLRFESGEKSFQGPQTPSLLVCSSATVDEWIW
ncbi:uncharacterized protein ACLA_031890 [Aspergillus clavatus NRRL 1]|uniref:Myocyte-specific enhancer factor 2d n=1 Tax=Aspergillus clavatus (strain ATCC 1007 / CBS 513.65 / DSM 816 / NCTC 3887 / NRRL 1 / QM 1276 / 107) TaxID=344612 RepID=A1CS33_ASPCL|nr:uncharacterized protein ACLA_031890 [Aspergillus clavatus NRRL 1]EAW08454.1 conserved hypothetical protein [Aspergillus clavatus NRRL 1]